MIDHLIFHMLFYLNHLNMIPVFKNNDEIDL